MNLSEFLNMGGYAFYVWSSYGLALVLLLWMFVKPVLDKKTVMQQLRAKYVQQSRQGKETENANERE